jgi:hypothetical protein
VEASVESDLHMRKEFVSEARLAPYVHDRHRSDHGVYACRWWCAVSVADRGHQVVDRAGRDLVLL